MRVEWLGHACFLITPEGGARIVTDPYDENVGYDLPAVEADVVTTSHDHFDHANVGVLKGTPIRIAAPGLHEAHGVAIVGHSTFHDDTHGSQRGQNVIFTIHLDGVTVCHLGDLGHLLTRADADAIGQADVLLVPVGGKYTIDKTGAAAVIDLLRPKIAIPMHVRNDKCAFPIETVDPFLDLYKDKIIVRHDESHMTVTADTLPSQLEIHVLQHTL